VRRTLAGLGPATLDGDAYDLRSVNTPEELAAAERELAG
jgi:hypothetical protein